MTASDAKPEPPLRPWRKRHPILSRSLLYGVGLGLAVLLLVLWMDRRDDDERVRVKALQEELDALSLVLATDPRGDEVLRQLDDKFSEPGLPTITRGRVLRWRAMAWRRKAMFAGGAADAKQVKQAAEAAVETALTEADALDLETSERVALHLEWAEARLERGDVDGAFAVLPQPATLTTVTQGLLFSLMRAQGLRLAGSIPAGLQAARAALGAMERPLGTEQQDYIGGRPWSPVQVAVELAGFVDAVGDPADAVAAWNLLRAAAPASFETQVAAARGLARGHADADARSAWLAAKALNARLAAAEAGRDTLLATLDRQSKPP